MSINQEMFRFVTTRRPERVLMTRIASRLIRDRRPTTSSSMLVKLFGPSPYEAELVTANAFAASTDFIAADDLEILALEPAVLFFREQLAADVVLADLAARMETAMPLLAALLNEAPPGNLLEATRAFVGRLWDSLYAQTIRGCDRYVSTNYLVDGLRVYHVLGLLLLCRKAALETWPGGAFDDYDALIDLNRAIAVAGGGSAQPGPLVHPAPQGYGAVQDLTAELAHLDAASRQIESVLEGGLVRVVDGPAGSQTFFDAEAARVLSKQVALKKTDLASTPVEQVVNQVRKERSLASLQREGALASLIDPDHETEYRRLAARSLAVRSADPIEAASMAHLAADAGSFRVPLSVGAIRPPVVGDLILVDQQLNRYEQNELADIQSIMRGERRERTVRTLARTSQTTTTESLQEQEETSSFKTDERFQLSSQAQQTASENFGVQVGVSVTGKFGPVQVGASVNASYDTSKSSSESTSQEYAKTVTEEATKRVKSSIKETSSITILTETQDTLLRGFNNEKGTEHVNGLYRWIDKIYTARLLNYGRRLMLSLSVPEPAAFYRSLLAQNEAALLEDLVDPVHPSRIGRGTTDELPETNTTGGYLSYQDLDEDNYAELAALYDVAVEPPPPEFLTGSKAMVYPEAMQAETVKEHDEVGGGTKNELNYVTADNTMTVDPSYRMISVAVFATRDAGGNFTSWVDALKLGEDGSEIKDANLLLVQVAGKSFHLSAHKDPADNDGKVIVTNFNVWQEVEEDTSAFGERVQGSIPITIVANFEGMFAFTVIYKASRLAEALDAWKAETFAAILKGYAAKKQAYDQELAAAKAKATTTTEAQTFQLRDDQYRSIELTELQRGCIDLLSAGTASGYTSIAVAEDGTPDIVYDPAQGNLLGNWRSPLANGSVAEFFQLAYEWESTVYQFHPYYWAGAERWKDLAQASGADPIFQQFMRAGSASVVVPVRPGYERPVILFLKTGLIWGGGYLSLFTSPDMLDVYADVELGLQLDPPEQIGASWEVRVPTTMVMLQEDGVLPTFPVETDGEAAEASTEEPVIDESVPF